MHTMNASVTGQQQTNDASVFASEHGPMTSVGGAWEAIIDKAVTQVTEYLTTSTREFDPSAPLSMHMLHLLDRSSVRDILVERNYNELCGCFGCCNRPRGLLWGLEKGTGGTLSFDWPSSSSSECSSFHSSSSSSSELDAGDDIQASATAVTTASSNTRGGKVRVTSAEVASTVTDRRDVSHNNNGNGTDDNEEIVYEDDIYTAESFRLAQRQRALLNRMGKKKLQHEQKKKEMLASAAAEGSVVPRVRRSGMLGASFSQRFCSAECEELYKSGVVSHVSPYFDYDYPSVFSAITNLFPNLSVAALQQLAGAEVSASWLLKPIHESSVVAPSSAGSNTNATTESATTTTSGTNSHQEGRQSELKPVQVGVSYESTEHLCRGKATSTTSRSITESGSKNGKRVSFAAIQQGNINSSSGKGKEDGGVEKDGQQQQYQLKLPLLRTVLEQMQVLQGVWNHEVVPRFSDSHLPRVPGPTTNSRTNTNSTTDTSQTPSYAASGVVSIQSGQQPPSSLSLRTLPTPSYARPTLRGSLLLFDFIMNTSGAKTRRLFYLHYTKHRVALQAHVTAITNDDAATENKGSDPASFFSNVSKAVIQAMEKKYIRFNCASGGINRSDNAMASADEEGDDLRTDPVLQQQRRDLLTSHLFSEVVAATLSRLLMVDYILLLNTAWSGVWFKDLVIQQINGEKESCSLLRSLLFPFAIPAVLLRAAAGSPEVTGLAMIYLIAAGCCSDAVWQGCTAEEVAFDEVADAIGLTEADVTAAVRSLMLGEEE